MFKTNDYYENENFTGLALDRERIKGVDFQDCEFKNCSFMETVFDACSFDDCVFLNCNFSLMSVPQSLFIGSSFKHSKLVGINWTKLKASFQIKFDFYDCIISHSSFMGLNFSDSKFVKCIAIETNFSETEMTGSDCSYTKFEGALFVRANISEADFRGAESYSIDLEHIQMKKAIFSLPEAMRLLNSLDIVLE